MTCKVFHGSEYRHFRLARESEVPNSRHNIRPSSEYSFSPTGKNTSNSLHSCAACVLLALRADIGLKHPHLRLDKPRCFRLHRSVLVERLKSRTSFPRS
jgi:hypothetical protein